MPKDRRNHLSKPHMRWDGSTGLLHIEVPGAIVNIRVGLVTPKGQELTTVNIMADGDRYSGDKEWWINGEKGKNYLSANITQSESKEDAKA